MHAAGLASVELAGIVELLVVHEDNSLSAVISAERLRIAGAKGTSRISALFAAAMALVATEDRR